MKKMTRIFLVAVLGLGLTAFGCDNGGGGDDPEPGVDTMVGEDTIDPPTCDPACDDGFTCVDGACVEDVVEGCDPACDDGFTCVDGACVEDVVEGCDPACDDGFTCVDGACVEDVVEGCDPACDDGFTCVDGACVEDMVCEPPVQDPDFVGKDKCIQCHGGMHPEVVDNWIHSGHGYKLNPVIDGQPPIYPDFAKKWWTEPFFDLLPGLGYTWDDITYVIGGYGWKARFIGMDGYIITGTEENPGVQWNLWTEEYVGYHTGEVKAYNCGACHTTGWVAADPDCPPNPDMPGFQGVYTDPQVSCEACHGGGAEHAANPSKDNIGDPTDSCINCHIRGTDPEFIPAKGGLTQHHEQSYEMLASPHAALSCSACHDPHAGTKYDADAPGEGVRTTCKTCHDDVVVNAPHDMSATCVDCHMPLTTKSATSVTIGEGDDAVLYGDIAGHIFKLTLDPAATLTAKDADDKEYTNDSVPVLYACKKCHASKTLDAAISGGANIHPND